ncbi:MAG: hypothetical protein WBQ68_06195 [Terriglobales bacterium]
MGAVGSYLRHIPNPADNDEFNQNIRRAHDGLEPVKPQLTAEQIKAVYEEALAADETRTNNFQMSDEFVLLHPEFIDNQRNGEIFNATLNAMFGANRAYTIDQFERVYQVCLANSSLELDAAELSKQEQAAAKERAKAARAKRAAESRVFSEAEKETMSLEELRRLEDREIQKRNQRLGEEGGYY